MDTIIITRIHHGEKFIQDKNGITYNGKNEVEYVSIDKDRFSIIELPYYTKQFGYITVDLYVKHVMDEVEVVTIGSLCGSIVEKNKNVVGEKDLQDVNVTAGEGLIHEAESENVNVEVELGDVSDLGEVRVESNQSSTNSQEDVIPDEDDSELDEVLRSLRNERRNKVKKKKICSN
ncbi:hypothetical protein H5410_047131 [Solanum commersonii]|uniref:PB1-like domain-containing protein n=1 Tax=Solanum commersonii TaxID=4109 RepID=A0A9J5XE70_SOLCO|nr:hypothetical protein H5410_047131 [Solanum commersonii]